MKRMLSLLCLGVVGHAASAQDNARILRDVEYAVVDAISLKLDLYLPAAPNPPTPDCLGAWRRLAQWIKGPGRHRGHAATRFCHRQR